MPTPLPRILSRLFPAFAFTLLATRAAAAAAVPFQHERLEPAWESSAPLTGAIAAHYDATDDVIYVARLQGSIKEGNAHGAIARLSTAGEVLAASWIEGLNEPRGFARSATRLFIADGQEILSVDVERARVVSRFRNDRAKALRAIAVLDDGRVYAADLAGGQLFELRGGIMGSYDGLESVHAGAALAARGNELFVAHRSRLFAFDPTAQKTRDLVRRSAATESFAALDDGSFLVCDGKGVIHLVGGSNEKPLKLLDPATGASASNSGSPAIGWVPGKRLLLIPQPAAGKVVALRLK